MAEKKKLGDVLKDAGLIDDFQLGSALSHQRSWGGKLGTILVELGFVQEQALAKALADKLGLQYVNLFEPEIPDTVSGLIKPEIAKKYQVVPVKKDAKTLVLAMSDPMDLEAIDTIRFATGCKIVPALAMGSEISDAIKKYYDREDITHRPPKVSAQQMSSDKMEIIPGSDLTMRKAAAAGDSSPILAQDDASRQMQVDGKVRLDALISLLIEKGIISRDEFVNMVYHKKMGL